MWNNFKNKQTPVMSLETADVACFIHEFFYGVTDWPEPITMTNDIKTVYISSK